MSDFLIKGYKKAHIWENDPNVEGEFLAFVKTSETNPDREEIKNLMNQYDLCRCEVSKEYSAAKLANERPKKMWLDLADIDCSDTVFFTFTNPHLKDNTLCNIMDTSFRYPVDKVHIIHMIKLAVRLGLKVHFHSLNEEAERFVEEYYKEYQM